MFGNGSVDEDNLNSHGQPADRTGGPITRDQYRQLKDVITDLQTEVYKAMHKHAPMRSPHEGHSVIEEEFDELWDHVKADTGRTPAARKEALQLAAMAVRYIIDLIDTPKED